MKKEELIAEMKAREIEIESTKKTKETILKGKKEEVVDLIIKLMTKKDFKQNQVAYITGIDPSTITRLLHDTESISLTRLDKYINILQNL